MNLALANYSGWLQAPHTQQNSSDGTINNTYDFASDMVEGSQADYSKQQYAPDPITIDTERSEYQRFWRRARDGGVAVGMPK